MQREKTWYRFVSAKVRLQEHPRHHDEGPDRANSLANEGQVVSADVPCSERSQFLQHQPVGCGSFGLCLVFFVWVLFWYVLGYGHTKPISNEANQEGQSSFLFVSQECLTTEENNGYGVKTENRCTKKKHMFLGVFIPFVPQ